MSRAAALAVLLLSGCPTPADQIDADRDGFSSVVDCDDANPGVNPGASEVCGNRLDDDCDGVVDDDGEGARDYYLDSDGDTFGHDDASTRACTRPEGYTTNDDDCDDGRPDIHPNAADDNCDGVDDNCSGQADEDSAQITVYPDGDGDGFGSQAAETDCAVREGFVENDDDCNDGDKDVNPGAIERCNAADDDCDTAIDEGISGSGPACTAINCKSILAEQPGATDGTYWLDLGEPYAIECVMEGTGTQGWTVFTGLDLRKLDMVDFSLMGGSRAGDWYAGWVFDDTEGRFILEPARRDTTRTDCETAVIRATARTPWDYDAWYGEFETEYSGYDNRDPAPGSEMDTCDVGAFSFANVYHRPKPNNQWPLSSGDTYKVTWPATEFPPTRAMIWELNGYSTGIRPRPGEELAFIDKIRIAVH